jgi:hypothetical protein
VAAHGNASIWFPYQGDRGTVDWLLNKTMLSILPHRRSRFLRQYFRLAHYLQLLAMTYVAAQKGWDGVCLLLLMIVAWIYEALLTRSHAAKVWARDGGIAFKSSSFRFTGRNPMIGAVQLLSDWQGQSRQSQPCTRNTAWMDNILVPCARRDKWLEVLSCHAGESDMSKLRLQQVDQCDRCWIENNTRWTIEAATCVKEVMTENRSKQV